jgi:hypothetical protein
MAPMTPNKVIYFWQILEHNNNSLQTCPTLPTRLRSRGNSFSHYNKTNMRGQFDVAVDSFIPCFVAFCWAFIVMISAATIITYYSVAAYAVCAADGHRILHATIL